MLLDYFSCRFMFFNRDDDAAPQLIKRLSADSNALKTDQGLGTRYQNLSERLHTIHSIFMPRYDDFDLANLPNCMATARDRALIA